MNSKNNLIKRLLPISGIRQVFEKAKKLESEGREIIHLEIGRPDWHMPPYAITAIKMALEEGQYHYISNRGLLNLRENIVQYIKEKVGFKYDAEKEVVVTLGASEALSMCCLALLGEGDEIIVPLPAWNHYKSTVEMVGAKAVDYNLDPENNFQIDVEELTRQITSKTKLIIINSPANPSGAIQNEDTLKNIAKIAMEKGIFIFSDEVYDNFVYEGEHISIGQYMKDSEFFIYVNSFSKTFAMTGSRVGFIASQQNISDAINRIHQYLTVCGVPYSQVAANAALSNKHCQEYLDEMRKAFKDRRNIWIDGLSDNPNIKMYDPKGAFYLFPSINYKRMCGKDFCDFILNNHSVAMVPGEVFGSAFKNHVRISYGRDKDTQVKAVNILQEVLSK